MKTFLLQIILIVGVIFFISFIIVATGNSFMKQIKIDLKVGKEYGEQTKCEETRGIYVKGFWGNQCQWPPK